MSADPLAGLRDLANSTRMSAKPKAQESDARSMYGLVRELLVDFPKRGNIRPELAQKLSPILRLFGGPTDSATKRVDALVNAAIDASPANDRNRWEVLLKTKKPMTDRLAALGMPKVDEFGSPFDYTHYRTAAVHEFANLIVMAGDLQQSGAGRTDITHPPGRGRASDVSTPTSRPHLSPREPFRSWRRTLGTAIPRPQVEAAVLEAVEAKRYPITLYGESGNGKTFLAYQVASELQAETGKSVAVIRVGANQPGRVSVYDVDLHRTLELLAIDPNALGLVSQEITIHNAVSRLDCPLAALILDDATPEMVWRLVPDSPAVPIIVTAREAVPDTYPVAVSAYEPDEALLRATNLLPEADATDLAALCSLLGRRPLVIDVALASILEGHATLDQLLASVQQSRVESIAASEILVGDADQQPLLAVYRDTLRCLDSDPIVMQVLDVFLWLTRGVVPRSHFNFYTTGTEPSPVEELQLAAAMTRLARLNLVTETAEALEMNALTRELLSVHCAGRVSIALSRFEATVLRSDAENLAQPGALIRGDFRLFVELMSEFLRQGEFAMAMLDDSLWVLYESGMPWRGGVSFGEGPIIYDERDPAPHEVTGSRYRCAGREWAAPSSDQEYLIHMLIRAYACILRDIYESQLSGGHGPRIGLTFNDDTERNYIHRCLEPTRVRGLTWWTVCGVRATTPPDSSDLAPCPACDVLATNEDHWRMVEADAEMYATIASYVSQPSTSLQLRLHAIRAESARRLGREAEARTISWSAIVVCVGDLRPDTETVAFFAKILDSACPDVMERLPDVVIEWIQLLVERDTTPGILLVSLIERLIWNGVDWAHAMGHLREFIAWSNASLFERARGQHLLAEVTLRLQGIEAAAPMFEAAIRSSALLPYDGLRLASVLEKHLTNYRDTYGAHG